MLSVQLSASLPGRPAPRLYPMVERATAKSTARGGKKRRVPRRHRRAPAGHPEILAMARQRVEVWLASPEGARFYAHKWAEVLKGDAASIAAFLVERSELATELRQSSPFAGALRLRERWKIWRETRERFLQGP